MSFHSNAYKNQYIVLCSSTLGAIAWEDQEEHGVIGHMPLELSKVAFHFVQSHGGEISATVLDDKMHRSNRAQGLVIKARYTFRCEDGEKLERMFRLVKGVMRDMTLTRIQIAALQQ